MDLSSVKHTMARDTLLYLPAKVIEGLVGFLTISLYTGYFAPGVYGYYTYVNTTVNIGFLLLMGWLMHACYRYVNSFKTRQRLTLFYSTAFSLWAGISLAVILACLLSLPVIHRLYAPWLAQLVFFSVLMFVTYSATQVLFSILGATRRIRLNISLSVFSVTAKLIVTTLLVLAKRELAQLSPVSAVISSVAVDAVVIAVVIWRLRVYRYIKIKLFSKRVLKRFLGYSLPLMGVSVTMSLLNLSDRYVISPLCGTEQLAVYAANYSVASSVFTMIMLAVMRGVYPSILKTWKKSNKAETEYLLSQGVRYFLIISLPSVVGLSVLSGAVARVFFKNPLYLSGSFVMIWVSIGMFFLGLTEYCNKAWELTSNTKPVLKNSLLSGLFNLASNLILVPVFGFGAAAVNTTASYILYFTLSFLGGRKLLKWHLPLASYARIAGSSALLGAVLLAALAFIEPSIYAVAFLVILGAALYISALYFSGEIRSEAAALKNRLVFSLKRQKSD